nr:immunoglobulin heavy chain junction region [Homo sapiens]
LCDRRGHGCVLLC